MKAFLAVAAALLALAAPIAAQEPPPDPEGGDGSRDVRYYEQVIYSRVTEDTCTGTEPARPIPAPHGFSVESGTYWITMNIHAQMTSGATDRIRHISAEVRDPVGGLSLDVAGRLTIPSSLGATSGHARVASESNHTLLVEPPNAVNIWVNTTSIMGGNPIAWCHVDVTLHSLESIPMEVSLTQLEHWLPILFWGILSLWLLVRLRLLAGLAATLVFLGLFIDPWPLTQTWGFIALALLVWIEILADRGAYGKWRRGETHARIPRGDTR